MAKLMRKLLLCFTFVTFTAGVSGDEVPPCTVLCSSCENPCQPPPPPPPALPECPPPPLPPSPPPPPPPLECPPPPMPIPSASPPQAPAAECHACENPPMPLSPPSPPKEPSSYNPPPSGAAYFAPPLYTYNPTPVYVPQDDYNSMAGRELPVFTLIVSFLLSLGAMCVFLF